MQLVATKESRSFKTDNVKLIRQILGTAYRHGFSILKELIQNANDANAKKLEITYINGLNSADHILLKRPLISVFNDGNFTADDRNNIEIIAGPDKEDKPVIGKYGLGMKSVFHLCDMIFIAGKDEIYEIFSINPCEIKHPEWIKLTDQDINYLKSLLGERKGMLLLIPLRTETEGEHITDRIPEPETALGTREEIIRNLPEILPLLWVSPNEGTLKRIEINLGWEEGVLIEKEEVESDINIPFKVFNINDISAKTIVVKSSETIFPPRLASDIIKEINDRFSESEQKRKTSTESAISITRTDTQETNRDFKLNFAVFLPLGDSKNVFTKKSITSNYSILLHGMFDCDSGRNHISYSDGQENFDYIFNRDFNKIAGIKAEDESEAKKYWNVFLAQYSVFPLIPIALDQAVRTNVVKQEDIATIIKNINSFFIDHKGNHRYISDKKGYSLTYQNGSVDWELFESDKNYIKLLLNSEEQHPFGWFFKHDLVAKLNENGINIILFEPYNDEPYNDTFAYIANKKQDKTLDGKIFSLILDNIENDIFSIEKKREYFKEFLKRLYIEVTTNKFIEIVLHFENKYHLTLFEMLFGEDNEKVKEIVYISKEVSLIRVTEISNGKRSPISLSMSEIENYCRAGIIFKATSANIYILEFYQQITGTDRLFSMSEEYWKLFDMKGMIGESKPTDILELLRNKDIKFNLSNIYQDEAYKNAFLSLLEKIENNHKDVFYKLPIHKVKGIDAFVPLSEPCFKFNGEEGNLFPNDFAPQKDILFVAKNNYDEIEEKESKFIKKLSEFEIIKLYLERTETLTKNEQFKWFLRHLNDLPPDEDEVYSILKLLHNKTISFELPEICKDEKSKKALFSLLKKIPDEYKAVFYKLPIHRVKGKEGFVSLSAHCKKFNGEGKDLFPNDFELPTDYWFVVYNDYKEIENKEKELILPLSNCNIIELYFKNIQELRNGKQFKWLLNILNRVFRKEEFDSIKQLLENKKWVHLNKNESLFVSPNNIFSKNAIEPELLKKIKSIPAFQGINIYSEEDIGEEYRETISKFIKGGNIDFFNSLLCEKAIRESFFLDLFPDNINEMFQYAKILQEKDAFYKLISFFDKSSSGNFLLLEYNKLQGKSIPSSINYYIEIMRHLNSTKYAAIKKIYIQCLDKLLSNSYFSIQSFGQFKFPKYNGSWAGADEIIYELDNLESIPENYRLDTETAAVLRKYKAKIDSQLNELNEQPLKENTSDYDILDKNSDEKKIRESINEWLPGVKKAIIGFFLFILKNNFLQTSQSYLYADTLKTIKELFPYEQPEPGQWNSNITSTDKMNIFYAPDGYSVIIKLGHDNTKIKKTLLGSRKHFDWGDKFEGEFKVDGISQLNIFIPKSNGNIPEDKIFDMIYSILWKRYNQISFRKSHYLKLFEYLKDQPSLTIKQYKKIIFNDILSLLRTLSLNNIPQIKNIIHEIDNLGLKDVMDNGNNKDNILKEIDSCKEKIIKIIEENTNIQQDIRKAIKAKLSNNQYADSSIVAEIFQNADDALNQRISYTETLNQSEKVFIIESDVNGTQLTFSHFGRGINYAPPDTQEDKANSWNLDLVNMLRLYCSDKDLNKDAGKFGLGFKSVYFAADEPQIHSDDTRLHFRIKAGFYPEEIDQIELKAHETRFVLELNHEDAHKHMLDNFRNNAFFQTIFSRAIKEIIIDKVSFSWNPDIISETDIYRIEKTYFDGRNYIAIHLKEGKIIFCSFLFEYENIRDEKHIKNMDRLFSKLWATTPLSTDMELEFAMNANFMVDTGRKTIVQDNDDNRKIIKQSGSNLGGLLSIIPSVDKINISSIFDTLMSAYENSLILKDLPAATIKKYGSETGRYPLGNDYFYEVKKNPVIIYFEGELKEIFKKDDQQEIKEFLRKYMPGTTFITSRYYTFYQNNDIGISINTKRVRELFDLLYFNELSVLQDKQDSMIRRFDELLKYYHCENHLPGELPIKVKTVAGTWEPANTVLIPGQREYKIFEDYAPPGKLLDEKYYKKNYIEKYYDFLLRYAYNFSPTQDEINSWIKNYKGKTQQDENKVVSIIGLYALDPDKLDGSWAYEAYDRFKQYQERQNTSTSLVDPKGGMEENDDIATIKKWWDGLSPKEKNEKVKKYYESLFPSIQGFDIKSLGNPASEKYLKSWFILFAIAIFQQIGRTTDGHNRKFIEFLNSKEWLDTMIRTDDLREWINIYIEYNEENVNDQENLLRMNYILQLYIIRKYIDTYINVFSGLNQIQNCFSLNTILTPLSNPELSGSDWDAPAVNRTFRIGASLIIRELLRNGILPKDDEKIVEHAFMPKSSIQNAVFGNNIDTKTSKQIYDEIKTKLKVDTIFTFDGYYDIPMLLYHRKG